MEIKGALPNLRVEINGSLPTPAARSRVEARLIQLIQNTPGALPPLKAHVYWRGKLIACWDGQPRARLPNRLAGIIGARLYLWNYLWAWLGFSR